MLNRSKRIERGNKEEQEEKKRKEKDELIDRLQRELNNLQAELDLAYDLNDKADKQAQLLGKLYEDDVIDEDGNLKHPHTFNRNDK